MKRTAPKRPAWRLADLLDFEALLASGDTVAERDRTVFVRDIRPRLKDVTEASRRSAGLRLWLAHRRETDQRPWPSQTWILMIGLLRWGLLLGSAAASVALVWGLCLGSGQRVHVVIFVGLTLVLPWASWVLFGLGRRIALARSHALPWLIRLAMRPLAQRAEARETHQRWLQALTDSRAPRRALVARAAGLMQWGGLGFSIGAVCAFLLTIMVFDVRFYWEATPDNEALMQTTVATLALPWAELWPAAVPDGSAIQASRLRPGTGQRPPDGEIAGAWWRFLVMALLVWGALPRLILIGLYSLRRRRALAGLDFQAPRHRTLWRQLAGVTRGAVADANADGALVLDVGGHGIDGEAVRGFLLRRLRVNPQATHRVSVLDADAEAAADAALADKPKHVVLMATDWALSPRQAARLHERVRSAIGRATPATWVIVGEAEGAPAPPAPEHLARWTAFIDNLRDPATEIAGYDPAA
ncbi:DUF2868 domain-containing protein [Salinisphaera sp. SPP-AMP-43]|uniref:DUF2868 domain-containing protein n=1 Tax=Salinisphaera sp. SPP-AMP-43 TaxID=3121288 RepID=UPI003C6DB94C